MNHTPTPSGPWAFYVYVAEKQTAYVTMDDDDLQMLDDMTNHNAEVTQLYPAHAELVAALQAIIEHPRTDDNSLVFMPREIAAARAALAKVQPANGYQRTPQQEQELDVMRSRAEL